MKDTVEDLESELQELLLKIDQIAQDVVEQKIDSYEGFMETQKYNDRVVEIGHLLKDMGIDITTRAE